MGLFIVVVVALFLLVWVLLLVVLLVVWLLVVVWFLVYTIDRFPYDSLRLTTPGLCSFAFASGWGLESVRERICPRH